MNAFTEKQILIFIYAVFLILMTIITFFIYLVDKKRAIKKRYRIPEFTLILFSLLGGAIGGFSAMLIYRHKTKLEHWYFSFFNILGVLIHVGILVCLIMFLPDKIF